MKKLSYMVMIAAAAFAFQGCNSKPKDAKESADSLNKTKTLPLMLLQPAVLQ
jgi:putative membrane protein